MASCVFSLALCMLAVTTVSSVRMPRDGDEPTYSRSLSTDDPVHIDPDPILSPTPQDDIRLRDFLVKFRVVHVYPELTGTVLEPFQDMFTPEAELPRAPPGGRTECSGTMYSAHTSSTCSTCLTYFAPYNAINGWFPVQLDWLSVRSLQVTPVGRCTSGSQGRQVTTTRTLLASRPRATPHNLGSITLKMVQADFVGFCVC